MNTFDSALAVTRKYCEMTGATPALAEPYFIASYLVGLVSMPLAKREKTIAQVVRTYEGTLERFVRELLRTRGIADYRRSHKALLQSSARLAYVEGMREAGGTEDDLDADDLATVDSWTSEQIGFVEGFARDIYAASGVGADPAAVAAVLARVQVWADSLRTLGNLGRASILRNKPGVWTLGNTEKHCPTCLMLAGQRHRIKWFTSKGYVPGQNGSKTLRCGGWECDCSIRDPITKKQLL